MPDVERISVFDTTLRDGEESPGCSVNLAEKVRLARRLEALGVDVIEAGFPVASEGDFAAVQAVAAECRRRTVAALCRTTEPDVLRAWEAVKGAASPRLHTFVATWFPPAVRASAVGSYLAVSRLGSVLGPLALGWIIAADLPVRWVFYALMIPMAVGVVVVLLLPRTHLDGRPLDVSPAVPLPTGPTGRVPGG